MENYIKQHDTAKQVAATGARALVVLVALIESPKTFEEIREFLVDCGVANKQYSVDTIRIDINTLKTIGCKISKATKLNDYCYHLISHPFRLSVDETEIKAIRKVYKLICQTATPGKLLEFHYLFHHLSKMTDDEKTKEQLLGISILKSADISLLDALSADEKKHNKIRILYQPPNHELCEYDITVEKLGMRSGQLYLYGYNHSINKHSFLNVSRIKKILCNIFDKNTNVGLDTNIKFKLYSFEKYCLDENEVIIESTDDYVLIRGRYFNDFIGIQRMLGFGSDCVVIEPDNIKSEVVKKLKEMRALYGK